MTQYQHLLPQIREVVKNKPSYGINWSVTRENIFGDPLSAGRDMCAALLEMEIFLQSRNANDTGIFDNYEALVRLIPLGAESHITLKSIKILNLILNNANYDDSKIQYLRDLFTDYSVADNMTLIKFAAQYFVSIRESFDRQNRHVTANGEVIKAPLFINDFVFDALWKFHDEMFFLNIVDEVGLKLKGPFHETLNTLRLLDSKTIHAQQHEWIHPVTSSAFASFGYWLQIRVLESTYSSIAETAFALKCYQVITGNFPENLEILTPDYLSEIPIDPCSGESLKYTRKGEGYVLYGIGINGIDDGGNSQATRDYLFDSNDETPSDIVLSAGIP